jgi:hypothetical protein
LKASEKQSRPVLPKMSMAADTGEGVGFTGLAVVKMSFIKFGCGRSVKLGKKIS